MTLELRCSVELLLVATEYLRCGKSELRFYYDDKKGVNNLITHFYIDHSLN